MLLTDFVNDVALYNTGCPQPVILRAVREALRTFCQDSTAYRKTLSNLDMAYASGLYTITIPTGTQILSVISPMALYGSYVGTDGLTYSYDNITIQGTNPEWLDIRYPEWRGAVGNQPAFFVMQSNNSFILTPDSGVSQTANLKVTLILEPDRTTATFDDEIGTRFFDAIIAGANVPLMLMANADWANPQLAQIYKAKFDDGIQKAKDWIQTAYRDPRVDGKRHVRAWY